MKGLSPCARPPSPPCGPARPARISTPPCWTRRAGVTPVTGVHWGHGIGVASQEAPWIAPGDATVLKEGMVLVLNPHVQGPGGTILYSRDTVLLDFNGCKILGWYKDWREPYVASDSYYSGGG